MLLGAAFRPLYVSFLPGAVGKDTGTSKATSHAMHGFDWMMIGLDVFFGGFYGGEMAETIRPSVKW